MRIISVTKVKESQIKSTFTLFNILKVKKNFQNPKIQVGFNRNKGGGNKLKTISDIIEEFILSQLEDGEINLSRNELANFFNCAPSQINYVLTTRFTPMKGFDVESKRGGGGYIKIVKFSTSDKIEHINHIIKNYIGDNLDYNNAIMILDNLLTNKIINKKEYKIIATAISNKSLSNPINNQGLLRAKILTNILREICKEE